MVRAFSFAHRLLVGKSDVRDWDFPYHSAVSPLTCIGLQGRVCD
jgi:hypothetical protein